MENNLIIEDLQNIGKHHDYNLMAWHSNFVAGWNELKEYYSDTFYRMRVYYLMCFAATFLSPHLNLWQIAVRKPGCLTEYESVRF